jgi:hypothetical protein
MLRVSIPWARNSRLRSMCAINCFAVIMILSLLFLSAS